MADLDHQSRMAVAKASASMVAQKSEGQRYLLERQSVGPESCQCQVSLAQAVEEEVVVLEP